MILTAFILGLLGSFHCIGMCGPVAFLLPLDRKSKTKRIIEVISYHSGRLFTYSILGLIFGILGKQLQLFGMQQQLSILIGALMILVILIPNKTFNRYNFSKPIYKWVSKLKSTIGIQIKKKEPGTFFTLGFLNGLLPCGLVYMAVFAAIGTGNMWNGALYMLLFGLGTIPLMTGAIYISNFLKGTIKTRILKLIPVFVIIVGFIFIVRGLGLGIPYLSPTENVTISQIDAKHNCH